MAIVLFDTASRTDLYPFTRTRAVAALRTGILTLSERWALYTREPVYIHTDAYLQVLYGQAPAGEPHIWVDARTLPDDRLLEALANLKEGHGLKDQAGFIAGRGDIVPDRFNPEDPTEHFSISHVLPDVKRLQYPWHLIQYNDYLLRGDYMALTAGRYSAAVSDSNRLINPGAIFLEEGARMEHCIINAAAGPVYIGRDAEVMEGTAIRGPFALGENAVVKMNSRIYGATSLGPYCMGGGKIKNSILMGHSNKAHDGYLGDSAIGEWCNLGAGATNSNLKNSAGEVKLWNETRGVYLPAGQKCGVFMGDYSRVAINSSINKGSVIGVSANVFGAGLLPKRIPDFSWGCDGAVYALEQATRDAGNWKKMKQQMLTEAEASVLAYIFAHHSK